jgi:hypothetical protein
LHEPRGLGNFQRACGEVNLTGTLNNINSVLNLDNYTGSWQMLGGTIRGGQASTDYFQGDPAARDDYYDAGQGFSNTQGEEQVSGEEQVGRRAGGRRAGVRNRFPGTEPFSWQTVPVGQC